jgi:hypothetical protein
VAWLWDIQVRLTLPDGQRLPLWCAALLGCLQAQPALIRGVEPLTPSLAFVLYVHDQLLAWDFTPLIVAHADDLTTTLLTWGDKKRREQRRRAFWARAAEERRQVLHDTVTAYLFEPGRLRLPMRGLLHAGWHDFGTGAIRRPSQILRYFDAALGHRRQTATPESALTPADQAQSLAPPGPPAPPWPDESEDLIQDLTASLPLQERLALQHRLRAELQGLDFTDYCAQEGLPYEATRKAARRGRAQLRRSR